MNEQNIGKEMADCFDKIISQEKHPLTGIELSRKEDGHWLSFTTTKGNSACLRIESLKDRFGYITWKAIMEWAEEQSEQATNQPSRADI